MGMVIVKVLTWFAVITAEYLDWNVVFSLSKYPCLQMGKNIPVLQGINYKP